MVPDGMCEGRKYDIDDGSESTVPLTTRPSTIAVFFAFFGSTGAPPLLVVSGFASRFAPMRLPATSATPRNQGMSLSRFIGILPLGTSCVRSVVTSMGGNIRRLTLQFAIFQVIAHIHERKHSMIVRNDENRRVAVVGCIAEQL